MGKPAIGFQPIRIVIRDKWLINVASLRDYNACFIYLCLFCFLTFLLWLHFPHPSLSLSLFPSLSQGWGLPGRCSNIYYAKYRGRESDGFAERRFRQRIPRIAASFRRYRFRPRHHPLLFYVFLYHHPEKLSTPFIVRENIVATTCFPPSGLSASWDRFIDSSYLTVNLPSR